MANDLKGPETGKSVAWRSSYRGVLSLDDDRSSIVTIDAPNDEDALALMSWIAEGRAFELWNGRVWIGQSPLR
ncbi:hypothetical protein MKK64_19040 [Methylobacterium sp. E-025]|uniref:hypothetical protein n=1 Tax=Methylobacterium sp. E-025 TaxID=2836561 RepID=UPI001FBAA40B|nr:hypothetical protein [Methylobacterium sp. E-025]MCJ2113276.1 hypothetical protein [Methylobacterium sp. E-025]